MNNIRHSIVAIYLLVMLFKFCHLNTNSHSQIIFEIKDDPSDSSGALQTFSKSFFGETFNNFSLFTLINHNGKISLFVVCRNDTIIQLAIESMQIINIFRKHSCPYPSKFECDDRVTINLVSEITLLNQKMMWYCYILPNNDYPSPSLTNCLVPKNSIFPEDLKWSKKGFSSTNQFYRTFSIQTKPYIFIGSYSENSLLIMRTKLPNIFGKIDSSQDLETPTAEFYFEKNSNFLEVFDTKYEVYYVIEEPITTKSHSIPDCKSLTDSRTVISTRLIRICKDDPGGVSHFTDNNFGTAAKANIVCPVGRGVDEYHFTRSISASWSGDKLYVLFESQKNSPPGKVLCVYDAFAFNVAFDSDIIPPTIFQDLNNNKIDNPIKDLCRRLTEKTLTEKEQSEATTLSTNGLYRSENILPITKVPLLNLRNFSYTTIKTFRLSKVDTTNLIILISKNFIRLVSHMEDDSLCQIQNYQFDVDEIITYVKGDNIGSRVFIHISTSKRVVQLKLSICDKFQEKMPCLTKATGICGWDSRQKKCTLLSDDVDPSRWQRSDCIKIGFSDVWTLPEKCNVKKENNDLSCTCKYCLDESECSGGKRVDITNCSIAPDNAGYGNWAMWSKCSPISLYQNRTRECLGTKCTGARMDYKKCQFTSSSVATTNWTKWYKSQNEKYHISLRAKCPINRSLPPMIEERLKICGESCLDDDSMKMSAWSDCVETHIKYRLLNCSTFDSCPYGRTDVRSCQQVLRKQQSLQGDKDGGYSIIHIVLAILIVSLVWLTIVIVVSICIFRFNSNHKKRSRRSETLSKFRKVSAQPYRHPFFQQHSILSETSNDYLTPDISSSSYNPINTDISSKSTIDSDRVSHVISRFPLLTDHHSPELGN